MKGRVVDGRNVFFLLSVFYPMRVACMATTCGTCRESSIQVHLSIGVGVVGLNALATARVISRR